MDLYLRQTDNAEMLMHFTDLPQSDNPSPVTEEDKDLSSFALAMLLEDKSREVLEEQVGMRGELFQAALCYALEWVCVSYWRMGSYPAQVLAGIASSQWLAYATWCARKNITDPLEGRLVDVLGRIWAWLEEPLLERIQMASKPSDKAQAKAALTARQIELFDREV